MLTIYAVSDSIGETAELVAKAAGSQFSDSVVVKRVPYINSLDDAKDFLSSIEDKDQCIVVSTIISADVREFLTSSCAEHGIAITNILGPIINIASSKLNVVPSYDPGALWNMDDAYFKRIEALEFAIQYDDSKDYRGLKNADIILVGLSRTSKTPLSLYLANKGYKTINIPLVPEIPIPDELFTVDRRKIFGLTINPLHLIDIRKHRIDKYIHAPVTIEYASDERILSEMEFSDKILKKLNCKTIDVTNRAIEDTCLLILESIRKINL